MQCLDLSRCLSSGCSALSEVDGLKRSNHVSAASLVARERALAGRIKINANPSAIFYVLKSPVACGKINFSISQVVDAGIKSRRGRVFWQNAAIGQNPILRGSRPLGVLIVEKTNPVLVFLDGAGHLAAGKMQMGRVRR